MLSNMKNEANGPFRKIAILGLGLMGSSLGLALADQDRGRNPKEKRQILTYDPTGTELPEMERASSPEAAVQEADLIILACPLSAYENLIKAIAPALKENALLIDLGSVKGLFNPIMEAHLPKHKKIQWVGGHPMCGSEKSGPGHGRKDLYQGATFFLTGGSDLDPDRQIALENLIEEIGSVIQWVEPHRHDAFVARTSHLPHISAALLMSAVTEGEGENLEHLKPYIAGGFKDMTRIAGGNEKIWKDICLYNKSHLLEAMEAYEKQLFHVKQLLVENDFEGLETFLRQTKRKRDEMIL